MNKKETSFRTTKVGSKIYKTTLDRINRTYKIEQLIVNEVTNFNIKGCFKQKDIVLNNGDKIRICNISYRHWESDKFLHFLYTTNKITALYNIKMDIETGYKEIS